METLKELDAAVCSLSSIIQEAKMHKERAESAGKVGDRTTFVWEVARMEQALRDAFIPEARIAHLLRKYDG